MLVNSFGLRSDEKERKTKAEGLLFPTEDDSNDEKERQRDAIGPDSIEDTGDSDKNCHSSMLKRKPDQRGFKREKVRE